MKLDRHEIAFLLRYSTAEKFCSSLKEFVQNLLDEQMIEECGKNEDGVPEYKVSMFGHMMVEKIENIVAAYGVEVFRIEKPAEAITSTISDEQISAAKSDNSHYAEEVDGEIFYYNDDAYSLVRPSYDEEE